MNKKMNSVDHRVSLKITKILVFMYNVYRNFISMQIKIMLLRPIVSAKSVCSSEKQSL